MLNSSRPSLTFSAFIAALAITTSAAPSRALPVSTNETVDHAAVLKQAPAYVEIPQELDLLVDGKKTKEAKRHLNLMQWNSPQPNDAYLVCVHAWGLSAREFQGFGEEMSRRGFDTAAIDVRGFGIDRKKKGMRRIDLPGTVDDIGHLLAQKRRENPSKKIFVVGESMGGAIALRVASKYPDLVDGVICSAPAWKIFSVKKITMQGLVDQVLGEPGLAARSVATMASKNEDLQRQWFSDSTYRMNYSVPEALGYYWLMKSTPKNAKGISDVPVLVIQGLNDRLSKPEASAQIFKKISNNSKQFAIVAGAEHLVLEENQLTTKVASFVDNWIINQMRNKGQQIMTPPVVVIGGQVQESEQKAVERLKELAGST